MCVIVPMDLILHMAVNLRLIWPSDRAEARFEPRASGNFIFFSVRKCRHVLSVFSVFGGGPWAMATYVSISRKPGTKVMSRDRP